MQLAIGLLTASLDSPELEALAVETLTPHDAGDLGNFMAGLHVVSELLHELHEATGEPPGSHPAKTGDPGRALARDALRRLGRVSWIMDGISEPDPD
jgi:hypothetical protein